jgi:hypothetical protein
MKRVYQWLAWRLPRRVLYWAVIRAWSIATTGQWSGEISDTGLGADVLLGRLES